MNVHFDDASDNLFQANAKLQEAAERLIAQRKEVEDIIYTPVTNWSRILTYSGLGLIIVLAVYLLFFKKIPVEGEEEEEPKEQESEEEEGSK